MIIARATRGKAELLLLGLSTHNVIKILNGQPLHIRREVHGDGVPEGWEIMIISGENEDVMQEQLQKAGLTPAVVVRDPKLDKTL